MRLILDINDLSAERSPQTAAQWTALIPAAGRGSRLNFAAPKILFPIRGKPILEWLIRLLKPLCHDFVFVLSPEGAPKIQPLITAGLGDRAQTVLQEHPSGMADAVALCDGKIHTPYTLVLWGDQITPRPRTLAACMTTLESSPSIQATMPTIYREAPYIHFVRDAQERIVEVYQARESDKVIERGESDLGLFLFRTEALFRVLRHTKGDPAHRGAKTKEQNLLSLIPLFHGVEGDLVTVRIHDLHESVGINTPADAAQVGRILEGRSE